ncbi:hypothetical protein FB451DRAFT_1126282 [Mycena latifolia]|nr:hypothetical protein FB451DRAFT_1126282 [Mycena latifolia]
MGAFVVLIIDPIASLDSETLEDPEAVAACKKLASKQYVALAEVTREPFSPYNSCTLELVLQGEPKSSPDKCMEPSMSVPIVPMTMDPEDRSHPSSRISLKPSNPLPWNDCYLSCFFVAKVRSPTVFTEAPIDGILDRKELRRRDALLIGCRETEGSGLD